MSTAYDAEAILIGSVLRYGRDAAMCVLPQLTSNKFIHNFEGTIGQDENRQIWEAIIQVTLKDRADPQITTGAVRRVLDEKQMISAEGYTNEVLYKYRIQQMDPDTLRAYAREVHRNGIVWGVVKVSDRLALLRDPVLFEGYVSKIEDPDDWMTELIGTLHDAGAGEGEGRYHPISEVAEEALINFDRQMSGEQLYLLPVGVPMLYNAGLFPAETMAVVHGLSSGGKTTFVQNVVNLGTAIGLVHNHIPGCVSINSLEMGREDFIGRAAASLAGFNTFTMKIKPQEINASDYQRFREYVEFVGQLPIVIDDTARISMDTLLLRLTGVHLGPNGPVRQLSTDYLELFDETGDESNVEQKLGTLAAKHFQIKREFHTCVIAVSQSTYTNKTYVAGMYGARYSKALTHKPDILIELVNYGALKKSGTDYVVANGLDEDHVWLLLQKYRGGSTDVQIAMGWEPEHTRIYDPSMLTFDQNANMNLVLFEHLAEVEKLLKKHPTTAVVPIRDTPLGDF